MFIEHDLMPCIVQGTEDTAGNGTDVRPGLREDLGAAGSTGNRCISVQPWDGEQWECSLEDSSSLGHRSGLPEEA